MKSEELDVLFEDNEIIVCFKPAGIAVESADIRSVDMVSLIKSYLSKNADPYLGIIHRLDQPVSGILVFAKTPAAAAKLSHQVQTDDMSKFYSATVQGDARKINGNLPSVSFNSDDSITITDYLIKDSRLNKALTVPSGNKSAKEARLILRVLSYNEVDDTSVLRIKLLTGRFHQIRAQLSNLGYPILGDVKYGAVADNTFRGIALCADELSFIHPSTGKRITIQHCPNTELGV